MKPMILSLLLAGSSTLWGMTPQLSSSMKFVNDMPEVCTEGTCKQVAWDAICNPDNVIFDANDDGSFDLVFIDFKAETDAHHVKASAQCHLEIPLTVPEGYRVALQSVAIAGITEVSQKGLSEASITHSFRTGRESVKTERFRFQNDIQDVIVNHQIDQEWTQCGRDREAIIGTKIGIVAQRQAHDMKNTFIAIDEGAGQRKAVYRLKYEHCGGQPQEPQCGKHEIAFNGKCRPLASHCSGYDFTDANTCNNGKDTLQCDYVPATRRCVAQCPQGHFSMDGQCYRKAQHCAEYNHTSHDVCNNGHDTLQCDWNSHERICFKAR
ncbi:DUF4360 domain-containing protein [Oligoflexus tunisiensis]|uniref:DUF4360 domain-containing protein n=1 Tax=Oligoflexus tunisiensis TaxID=708132 RepID=UPI00114CD08F|nr:DUF4360 domain-containing protein [Oligoflexus tunisiensis]